MHVKNKLTDCTVYTVSDSLTKNYEVLFSFVACSQMKLVRIK